MFFLVMLYRYLFCYALSLSFPLCFKKPTQKSEDEYFAPPVGLSMLMILRHFYLSISPVLCVEIFLRLAVLLSSKSYLVQ